MQATQLAKRPAWCQIDADAIAQNTRRMQALIGTSCQIFGVVKANAYGHGAVGAAQAMLRGGATYLVVATVGEACELRTAGIAAPILVLGPPSEAEVRAAIGLGVTLTIGDLATLRLAAAIAQARMQPLCAHLNIDTGMHRLGFAPAEVGAALAAVPHRLIEWTGICSHFACADQPGRPETPAQIRQFNQVLGTLANQGYRFPLVHMANSAAAIAFPAARYDAVRSGIALYGIAPSNELALPAGFAPALSFCTTIVQIADLPANSPISYGATYSTPAPRRIATIAAGYADGLRRSPAWREVLVGGQRVPIVGRICMDYAMIDITSVDADIGDEVVLLGKQGCQMITAEEAACWLDTTAYEVVTALG